MTFDEIPDEIELFGIKCKKNDLVCSRYDLKQWEGQEYVNGVLFVIDIFFRPSNVPVLSLADFQPGWKMYFSWFAKSGQRFTIHCAISQETFEQAKGVIEDRFKAMLDANKLIQGRII